MVSLASHRLPPILGQRYANVVVSCLTCLDPENEDFSDCENPEDPDKIFIGVRYIEKVSRVFLVPAIHNH